VSRRLALTDETGSTENSTVTEANGLGRADAPAELSAIRVNISVERLIAAGFAIAAVAAGLQTLGHLTNSLVLDYRVYNLDADVDGNVLAWASSAATFAAGLFALLCAYVLEGRRRVLLALAAVLILFSADDIVALHEHLGQGVVRLLGVDVDYGRLIWPPFYLPLMLFALLVLGSLALHGPEAGRRPLKVGLVLLISAVPLEMLWAIWHVAGGNTRSWPDALEVALEEGLELSGWILVATGLAAFALASSSGAEEAA
jgi:hypothetical protein